MPLVWVKERGTKNTLGGYEPKHALAECFIKRTRDGWELELLAENVKLIFPTLAAAKAAAEQEV